MIEYPKINTIWKRDNSTHRVIEGDYSCPEFKAIDEWIVTEKIDGTNIRVSFKPNDMNIVKFAGRTDNAQIPPKLKEYLEKTFTSESFTQFDAKKEITLFGEGYGAKIQNGGRYRKDNGFVLFDVLIDDWWLEFHNVIDVAKKLGIPHVPYYGNLSTKQAIAMVTPLMTSKLAEDDTLPIEGIVATSNPMMMFRHGGAPIRWKLKVRDLRG